MDYESTFGFAWARDYGGDALAQDWESDESDGSNARLMEEYDYESENACDGHHGRRPLSGDVDVYALRLHPYRASAYSFFPSFPSCPLT